MNNKTHLYLMGGLVIVGAMMLFTGGGSAFGGGGLFLMVSLGLCFAMMFFMIRGMGGGSMRGMGGKGADTRSHHHDTDGPNEFEDDSRRPR